MAHLSNVSEEQASELGRVVGALVGLDVEDHQAATGDNRSTRRAWTCSTTSPRLRRRPAAEIEHHWAVPLRDAIVRAGGFRIADGFISPLDLVVTGLVSAQEADELHAIESGAATTT